MNRDEAVQRVLDALRAARWARRAGWRPIVALYLQDAARWRGVVQMMDRCGMPCLPAHVTAGMQHVLLPPF